MKYTINGKEYSEFDINVQCSEILAWDSEPNVKSVEFVGGCFWVESIGYTSFRVGDYCNNPADCWPIIEKCWGELNQLSILFESKWESTMNNHNCTKLVAACICLIEMSDHE